MEFVINSLVIDIIVAFILLIMLILGYIKGFVYRGYDLIATIISLVVSLYILHRYLIYLRFIKLKE